MFIHHARLWQVMQFTTSIIGDRQYLFLSECLLPLPKHVSWQFMPKYIYFITKICGIVFCGCKIVLQRLRYMHRNTSLDRVSEKEHFTRKLDPWKNFPILISATLISTWVMFQLVGSVICLNISTSSSTVNDMKTSWERKRTCEWLWHYNVTMIAHMSTSIWGLSVAF